MPYFWGTVAVGVRTDKVMDAVQLGASGYVRKPFTADQIKEKLSGLF